LGTTPKRDSRALLELTSRVKVIFSTKSLTYIPPETLNLSHPGLQDQIVGQEDPSEWDIKHLEKLCA
jgi:hypothetical protein